MAVNSAASERTPLIAGNWKMNLDHLQSIAFVQKLAWTLKDARHDSAKVEVAVFPPFTDLRSVQTLVNADDLPIVFGGQDLSAARQRRLHGRDLGRLPQGARLDLRDHRALGAPAVPRRDR